MPAQVRDTEHADEELAGAIKRQLYAEREVERVQEQGHAMVCLGQKLVPARKKIKLSPGLFRAFFFLQLAFFPSPPSLLPEVRENTRVL